MTGKHEGFQLYRGSVRPGAQAKHCPYRVDNLPRTSFELRVIK